MTDRFELGRAAAHERAADVLALDLFEELAPIGTWELDLDRRLVLCSPRMLRLHEVTVSEDRVPLESLIEQVHPDDQQGLVDAFDEIVCGGELLPELDYRVLGPAGAVRHLAIRGAPIDPARVPRRFGGVVVDVTRTRTRELELAEALEREQHATADLRSADELKNLFLQALSHDLRTPLTVIEGFASLLVTHAEELDPDQLRDYADRIGRSARRLHHQLSDLLDVDRLGRGVLEPDRHPVELRRLASDVIEALDLTDRVVVTGDPVIASVDVSHLERMLDNLVINAVRHTPPSSIIEVRCEGVDGGVVIAVEDDGPGVPDSLKDEIFELFGKADPMSAGTGIGLSLVRRFAELHGGQAWVEDRPGGGSSFQIHLPA